MEGINYQSERNWISKMGVAPETFHEIDHGTRMAHLMGEWALPTGHKLSISFQSPFQ